MDIPIPFQFNNDGWFVCVQFSGQETDIGKAFSCGQFTDNGIVLPCKIKREMNGAA
jgi:hypothetical protein